MSTDPQPTQPEIDSYDDDVVVLPWWRNPLNIIVLTVAFAILCGAAGFVIGNNRALPDPNATDVGYLQDMRTHHDQAVQMSLIFLTVADTDPSLRTVAREIIVGQSIETGRMIQLLRDFGKAEANETDTAMGWMGHAMSLEMMPGMAMVADLDMLGSIRGRPADELFVKLMITHHRGGVEMAQFAQTNGATDEVRLMAKQTVVGQLDEVEELTMLLAAGQAA